MTFRISGFDLTRKSLYLRVIVTTDKSKISSVTGKRSTFACFDPVCVKRRPHLGDIYLPANSRKLKLFAMHESIHAAFEASRVNCEWPVDEFNREEYIVSTAEAIYEKLLHRLRQLTGTTL